MVADHDSRLSGFEPTTFQLPFSPHKSIWPHRHSRKRVIVVILDNEISKRGMDTVLLCFCSDVPHLDFLQAWCLVGGACVRRMMSSLSMLPPAAVTSLMHSTDPPPLSSVCSSAPPLQIPAWWRFFLCCRGSTHTIPQSHSNFTAAYSLCN